MVTVFTPSYNRADYLPSAFESLKLQTCHDFEWVIVDDGSTDATESVVREMVESADENLFEIRYFKKENGGKHTAINLGVEQAHGDFFLILDSDDTLASNAIATIIDKGATAGDTPDIGGVCFYMAHHDGCVIGNPVIDGIVTDSIDMRYRRGITGDMLEVFHTKVLREFPFPVFANERFCPEALVWNRIAQKYKLRLFKDVLYYRDYIEGGLTDRTFQVRKNSPKATCLYYRELSQLNIPLKQKIKAWLNYFRFRVYMR